MAGGRIFINYRRDDSRADAGRLYDRLSAHFPGNIFRDVASLEPGVEWHDAIVRVIGQSDACIVVIGKNWLNIADAAGRRRLEDPHDTVRQEVVAAIERKMRVFPVLVGGAKMPEEADLPPDLQSLCRRNALEITEQDWDEGFRKLVRALETSLGITVAPAKPVRSQSLSNRLAIGIAGALALVALVVVAIVYNREPDRVPVPVVDLHPSNSQGTTDSSKKAPPASSAGVRTSKRTESQVDVEAEIDEPSASAPVTNVPPLPRPLVRSWRFIGSGEELVFFSDYSLLIPSPGLNAVGRWKLDSTQQSVMLAVNPLTMAPKFQCRLKGREGSNRLAADCVDENQQSWRTELAPIGMVPVGEMRPDIPGVNVASLSQAESVQFARDLSLRYCTCRICVKNLLVCSRNADGDHPCPASRAMVHDLLDGFLSLARR